MEKTTFTCTKNVSPECHQAGTKDLFHYCGKQLATCKMCQPIVSKQYYEKAKERQHRKKIWETVVSKFAIVNTIVTNIDLAKLVLTNIDLVKMVVSNFDLVKSIVDDISYENELKRELETPTSETV
jgi:hypothetical protein